MMASQIFLYAIAALVVFLYVRRWYQRRNMKEYSVREVQTKLADPSVVLLDVRTKEERNQISIPGSLHIPINELASKIHTLERYKTKEIVCYCHSGNRSFTAAAMLAQKGFQAVNMKGGMVAWNYANL